MIWMAYTQNFEDLMLMRVPGHMDTDMDWHVDIGDQLLPAWTGIDKGSRNGD